MPSTPTLAAHSLPLPVSPRTPQRPATKRRTAAPLSVGRVSPNAQSAKPYPRPQPWRLTSCRPQPRSVRLQRLLLGVTEALEVRPQPRVAGRQQHLVQWVESR